MKHFVTVGMQASLSFVPRLQRPRRVLELEARRRVVPAACLRLTCDRDCRVTLLRVEAPGKSWMQRIP